VQILAGHRSRPEGRFTDHEGQEHLPRLVILAIHLPPHRIFIACAKQATQRTSTITDNHGFTATHHLGLCPVI